MALKDLIKMLLLAGIALAPPLFANSYESKILTQYFFVGGCAALFILLESKRVAWLTENGFLFSLLSFIWILGTNILGNFAYSEPFSIANFSDLVVVAMIVVSCLFAKILRKRDVVIVFFVVCFINVALIWAKLNALSSSLAEDLYEVYRFSEATGPAYWRLTGHVGQAGQLGLMAFLLTAGMLFICAGEKFKNKFHLLILFVGFMLLVASQSRVAWGIFALFSVLFVSLQRDWRTLAFLLSGAGAFALVAAAWSLLFVADGSDMVSFEDRLSSFSTGSYRIILLQRALEFSSQMYFIGTGGLKVYLDRNGALPGFEDLTLRNPDSQYALILVRYGIFGLALYASFLVAIFKKFRPMLHGNGRSYFISAILSVFAYGFFDPIFISPINTVLAVVMLLLPRILDREGSEPACAESIRGANIV